MKKKSNKGFMLAETLIVTSFVAGILIFLFIQFTNLNENYEDSYSYNSVDGLYALRNIKNYIKNDSSAYQSLSQINSTTYIDMSDCANVFEREYCERLLELVDIKKIYIVENYFDTDLFSNADEDFKKFIGMIDSEGNEKYRLLAEFNDSTYATIRFGG